MTFVEHKYIMNYVQQKKGGVQCHQGQVDQRMTLEEQTEQGLG